MSGGGARVNQSKVEGSRRLNLFPFATKANAAEFQKNNRPNLTGVTQAVTALEEKQLELLHELTHSAVLVGFLVNSKNPNYAAISERMEAVAKSLGLRLLQLPAISKDEIEPAFAMGREKAIGALLIHNDTFLREHIERLVQMTVQYRIPTMFSEREQVIAGGLRTRSAVPCRNHCSPALTR